MNADAKHSSWETYMLVLQLSSYGCIKLEILEIPITDSLVKLNFLSNISSKIRLHVSQCL